MEMLKFFVTFCITISVMPVWSERRWSYEIVEIIQETNNPDVMDLKLEIVRLSRAEFGVSGYLNIQTDLYDNVTMRSLSERSKERSGPYTDYPMNLENQTLSTYMNSVYKNIAQPVAETCTENAPKIEGVFEPPLEKRNIKISGCIFSTDSMPSVVLDGYYRLSFFVSGPVEVFFQVLVLVENDIL